MEGDAGSQGGRMSKDACVGCRAAEKEQAGREEREEGGRISKGGLD